MSNQNSPAGTVSQNNQNSSTWLTKLIRECPIVPAPGYVVVVRRPPRRRIGSLELPDMAQQIVNEGWVLVSTEGPVSTEDPEAPQYLAGDYVFWADYAGLPVRIREVDYLILSSKEILGMYRDPEPLTEEDYNAISKKSQ